MNALLARAGPSPSRALPEGRPAVGRIVAAGVFFFGARDFHTNVIKSSTTLKLNTSHGANGVMIFYVELDADNGAIPRGSAANLAIFKATFGCFSEVIIKLPLKFACVSNTEYF